MTRIARVMAAFWLLGAAAVPAAESVPAGPAQKIPLAGVQGRIDHLAVDLEGKRLFVAALGNNTLEVLDLATGKRTRSIAGMREPQGVAYLAKTDRIVVANGGDGTCRILDGRTCEERARVECGDDADNVRYDPAADRLYVGYGKGGLAVIDAALAKRIADIRLAGHPESFQLEARGPRVFVNVPTARQIAVIDRQKSSVVATWPVNDAEANFPMALDEADHRLFVGCRKPAKMLVIDTENGKTVASVPCSGDTDDLFYDTARRQIYVTGGEGTITVIGQTDADRYQVLGTTKSAAGARTSLYVPQLGTLYLAVPDRGPQKAEIWAYRLQPAGK